MSATVEQMRLALGLGPEVSDAAVIAAYDASGLDYLYLTVDGYIERFGRQEAILLTDEGRIGQPDTAKIETAISDATEVVDGYIGTRYPRPIRDVPRLLETIVAALARENLHTTRPTPTVKEAADRARAQLRDIQAKRMSLPIAEGATPLAESTTGAGSSGPRTDSILDRNQLDRYSSLGGGGYWPNWRR